jgi:Domain of unknown function DUF29
MKTSASSPAHRAQTVDLYDTDFFEWTQRTAHRLRARRFAEVDVEHAAEEIGDMGKRDLRELNTRTEVLLAHLLKWKFQPRKRSRSWRATIVAQRHEIEAILEDSPSLRRRLVSARKRTYERAAARAAAESGLRVDAFPPDCPFSSEEILEAGFLPD